MSATPATEPVVTTERSAFARSCAVTTVIAAPPATVWEVLTDLAGHATWNSTVEGIDGTLALGERLVVRVPGQTRVFKVKVGALDAPRSMTWRAGTPPMFGARRTFVLKLVAAGTRFEMAEGFSGLMMPLIGRTLPDFQEMFAAYARDLATECERRELGSI